jgi:phage shock protein A
MLDSVKQNIKRLIAAYEAEKELRVKLQNALDQANAQNEACRKQITELERQIDNLKLAEAFKAGSEGSPEAKKKINSLLKEIDRCISLLEG